MRKWGIVISLFYAAIVVVLLIPAGLKLAGDSSPVPELFTDDLPAFFGAWLAWVPIVAVIGGQVVLLFLSVDTSFRKLKPRAHVAVSVIAASMLFALLLFAGFSSIGAMISGDKFIDRLWGSEGRMVVIWIAIWAVWGVVFFLYARGSAERVSKAVGWLLKGSVAELLIAVPCHVWVRRRNDCSAPVATSFGIVAGIAIMLLSFGPSILLLYKKRLDAYPPQSK